MPNFIDKYHISETTEIFIQESSGDSRPSNLHDLEIDDYTIGRALSSPLFQERGDPASRRQAYHSLDESLLSSQSSSVVIFLRLGFWKELASMSECSNQPSSTLTMDLCLGLWLAHKNEGEQSVSIPVPPIHEEIVPGVQGHSIEVPRISNQDRRLQRTVGLRTDCSYQGATELKPRRGRSCQSEST